MQISGVHGSPIHVIIVYTGSMCFIYTSSCILFSYPFIHLFASPSMHTISYEISGTYKKPDAAQVIILMEILEFLVFYCAESVSMYVRMYVCILHFEGTVSKGCKRSLLQRNAKCGTK